MTMTGLRVFDDTLHSTQTWLHELESRLGLENRQTSYRVMRAGLHTLRDALEVHEVAHLSAQLPMLMRGFFFEGWRPANQPAKLHEPSSFFERMRKEMPDEAGVDVETAMREIIAVMRMHVTEGEMEDVRGMLPQSLRDLWEPA